MLKDAFAFLFVSILFLTAFSAVPRFGRVSAEAATAYGLCVSVHDVGWNDSRWMSELELSGCDWIKMDVLNDNLSDYLGSLDCLALLHSKSVKCLGVFDQKLNRWNTTLGSNGPYPIDNLTAWQTLVHRALQNYSRVLDAVECWNEPDDEAQNQKGCMNGPENYTEMLRILYNETKTFEKDYNKTIDVVAGSVLNIYSKETTPEHDVPGNGTLFIQAIRDLGSDDYCDAYSMHIYKADKNADANPEQFLRNHTAAEAYVYVKNITEANTTDPKPLWVTEMGIHNNTDEGQATQMQTWFRELTGVSCPIVFWHNYIDSNNIQGILETGTFRERAAFHVFSSMRIPGDVTGKVCGVPDFNVNMRDIGLICRNFGSRAGTPGWENVVCRNCDMNDDLIVDMRDIGIACITFGRHYP